MDKNKKVEVTKSQPTANMLKSEKSNDNRLAFKPYEINVLTRKSDEHRPLSKSSSIDENLNDEKNGLRKDNNLRVSSRSSNLESPSSIHSNSNSDKNHITKDSESNDSEKHNNGQNERKSPGESSQKGSSPIIRSGLEMLQNQQKEAALGLYKQGFNPFYPSGIDHTNPAFRSAFPGALSQHASMLAAAAAAAAGYPGSSSVNPYLSYARVKTPTGGEALVPVCKDPYCTGCQYSAHNQQMLMGAPCPAGCTQCEHQKYGLAMSMSQLPANHPFNQISKPFACNWVVGDSYCGKRFNTTDELIQHMKTHSPSLSDPATAASILAAQQSASLMSPLGFFPPGLTRGYPNAPLSPLSASRYHPYAKPGALPTSLPASPYSFNPALAQYYPPYSLYGQRIGAVHP